MLLEHGKPWVSRVIVGRYIPSLNGCTDTPNEYEPQEGTLQARAPRLGTTS